VESGGSRDLPVNPGWLHTLGRKIALREMSSCSQESLSPRDLRVLMDHDDQRSVKALSCWYSFLIFNSCNVIGIWGFNVCVIPEKLANKGWIAPRSKSPAHIEI